MTEFTRHGFRRPGVLVVDDQAFLRALLEQTLPLDGFAVWVASGAADALATLSRHRGEIDAALVDLPPRGVDGPNTVFALRLVKPGLPCCLMTGSGDSQDPRVLATGCPLFHKPFSLAEVVRELRALLTGP